MTAKSRYKRYFLANGTDARVRSHSSCNTPPRPSPSGAMAIVNCSTAWASRSTFMSTRAKSYCASYRSEEHTSELQLQSNLVCRLLLEKKKNKLMTHSLPLHT